MHYVSLTPPPSPSSPAPPQSSTPLIFIHGASGDHRHFRPQLEALKDSYTCFGLDLPGHGQSSGPTPETVDQYARAVTGWMRDMELPPSVVVGHSMGGAIALTLALNNPAVVDRLIIIGSGAHLPVSSAFLEELRAGAFNKDFLDWAFWLETDREWVEWAKRELFNPDPALAYNDFKACSNYDVRPQITRIRQPSLVLCGEGDKLTPVSLSRELADSLPQANLELIVRSGHMVTLEKPSALSAAIRRFLRESGRD